jgi:predicted enzyme related to lactoylglutathione lyase
MVRGINQVVLEVDDQDRAQAFWTGPMGFQLARDVPYRDERWLEVRTPDGAVTLVLALREGNAPSAREELPTSNIFFYCDDLTQTYEELSGRGVEFPQPPVQQPFGWWSMFQDTEGNRFALAPREASAAG